MNRIIKTTVIFTIVLLSFIMCSKNEKASIIKIGCIQQLTKQMAKYGETQVAAVTAMMEIVNKDRAEKGLPQFQLLVGDDQLSPATGVNLISKYIDVDKVIAVIGAQGSSVTLAMAPIAEKNKIILISGASGSPEISQAGDYIFRTCPSDIYEGSTMADYYIANLKNKPLAILYINNDYGLGLKKVFLERTSGYSTNVLELGFNQGATDFRNQLTKIKQTNIDVVYLIGYDEMITIYKQAKELGLNCQWLGNNQLNDQSLIDKMGLTADGTIFPGHNFQLTKIKSEYSAFYNKYLELSKGVELDVFAAYGADAFIVINYAIENGAKTSEEIKNILYNTGTFKGLLGDFKFDKNGDAVRELGLYQILKGKIVKYEKN